MFDEASLAPPPNTIQLYYLYSLVIIYNVGNNVLPCSGVASAPAVVSVGPAGFTGIYVNVTIPNDGSICVDEYRASISGIPTSMPTLTQTVTNVTQTVYRFRFPVDLCSNLLTGVSATALAITDGLNGPSLMIEAPTDTLNRSGKVAKVYASFKLIIFQVYVVKFYRQPSTNAM